MKTPDLAVLRDAINDLEWASLELDEEKVEAERELREILENLPEQTQTHSRCKRRNGILNRIATWIKFIYGVQLPERHQEDPSISRPEDFYHLLASDEELQALEFALETDQPHEMLPRFPPNFPIWKFLKAARRVGKVNQKLIAYERGFISKGGIKDREWYKHLVVAPGKWLGMCQLPRFCSTFAYWFRRIRRYHVACTDGGIDPRPERDIGGRRGYPIG